MPLHIDIARNAILEKIPEGRSCPCTDNCSSRSTVPSNRTSPQKKADPPVEVRKRRRIDLESQHRTPNHPPVGRHHQPEGQPIAVERGQIPHGSALKPGEIPTRSCPQSTGTFCAVQTPRCGKSGMDAVTRDYLRNTRPWSGNAALATRLSTISRGKAPYFILVSHSEHSTRIVRQRNFSYSFEGEFALSIRGYMTCLILRRSLLRLSTERDSYFLMMMTTTTTSFECSHVIPTKA